jgi:hypothetical protein
LNLIQCSYIYIYIICSTVFNIHNLHIIYIEYKYTYMNDYE